MKITTILKLFSIFVFTGLYSCSSVKSVQNNFASTTTSLAYLYDSNPVREKKEAALIIDVKADSLVIKSQAEVEKKHAWCVPLIAVNIWDSEMQCNAGCNMIEEDVESFVQKSFEEEVDRSCLLNVTTTDSALFHLEIELDTMQAIGPYKSSGFFYFILFAYGYSYYEYAGPALSSLKFRYKLYLRDDVVFEDEYCTQVYTNQLQGKGGTTELQKNYGVSMVEAMSESIKLATEFVVNRINAYIESV